MGTAVLRAHGGSEHQGPTASRGDVLAGYRHLREIGKQHHSNVLGFLPRDAVLQQARRLGLATGRTILVDSPDELTLAFDLAIYTAPAGRSRAVDRYARSTLFPQGSDEAVMLAAMCGARFAILAVQRQHPVAGLLVTDVFRQTDLWLLDEGLEQSLAEGAMFATRYYTPADFVMTAGIGIPIDLDFLEAAILTVPQLQHRTLVEALGDRRFAEAIYKAAIAEAVMEGVSYQDPDGDTA
ncbi:MAG TPA: hypothetical protein VFE34_11690 [Dongiaceae bacterium]|jgi:hypothetical protein|nr:hypothetical protein [Dongiaceae bacterium]